MRKHDEPSASGHFLRVWKEDKPMVGDIIAGFDPDTGATIVRRKQKKRKTKKREKP
jgi:hypothetical protein